MNGTLPEPVRDVVLLVARLILGVVLFAHGWQKLVIYGIAGTRTQFEAMGIPLAIVSSSFVSFVEFVGGALMIFGALVPVVVVLHLVVMIGAASFVHVSHGIFAVDGGWELVGVIAACELMLGACGAGRFSVDRLVLDRRQHTAIGPPAAVKSAEKSAVTSAGRPAESSAGTAEHADVEAPTSVFLAVKVKGSGSSAQSSAPVFPEPSEQPGVRARRVPRPITPLQGRDGSRRPDPRRLDRSDDSAGQ
jgi:putative oxidoreductase